MQEYKNNKDYLARGGVVSDESETEFYDLDPEEKKASLRKEIEGLNVAGGQQEDIGKMDLEELKAVLAELRIEKLIKDGKLDEAEKAIEKHSQLLGETHTQSLLSKLAEKRKKEIEKLIEDGKLHEAGKAVEKHSQLLGEAHGESLLSKLIGKLEEELDDEQVDFENRFSYVRDGEANHVTHVIELEKSAYLKYLQIKKLIMEDLTAARVQIAVSYHELTNFQVKEEKFSDSDRDQIRSVHELFHKKPESPDGPWVSDLVGQVREKLNKGN